LVEPGRGAASSSAARTHFPPTTGLRLGLIEPTLCYNRGNLLREAGRLDEAIASYDEALRLNPAYPEALRAGALVLRDLGQSEAALEFLDEATRLRPDFIEALLDRGEILQILERLEIRSRLTIAYCNARQITPPRGTTAPQPC
jgi:tetratricopeptide (TPR) repeat protein